MAESTKLKTQEDCEDFLNGARWLGVGGGGTYDRALSLLTETLESGLTLEWVAIDSVPDDAWTATFSMHGSLAPKTQETLDEIERLGLVDQFGDYCIVEALNELAEHVGQKFSCLVPSEMGPESVAEPLAIGAHMGIPVMDGDYIGRGVPEETQSTYCLYGKQSNFFASVDAWGNRVIVKHAAHPQMLERIAKMLAIAAYGETAVAATPLLAKEAKKIVVPGTLTKCLSIGRALRRARASGDDPVDAGVEAAGGWRIFDGTVSQVESSDQNGYWIGSVKIDGTGEHSGSTLDVWFKNENLVSWLNGSPWICNPDLLMLIETDGRGIYNTDFRVGQNIVAVGMKGVEGFRTEKGLRLAGPRHFGFDIDYVPIEELIAS